MKKLTRERDIEAYFVKRVKEAGGLSFKFVSPGVRGVPDRIVILKGCVSFVELKAPFQNLRADQQRMHDKLDAAGADTHTLRTKEAVDMYIDYLKRWAE